MAFNTFVPTGSSRANEVARSSSVSPSFIPADDPVSVSQATTSYEWLDYGTYVPGQGTTRWETNPPFLGMEAGRLLPGMVEKDTAGNLQPARIVRGYIRRAEYSAADRTSKCRLYFMYNPETITRSYVNYLDQGALDPFNTVFQSGNLVAPPSILDFTFELFFDRQHEARHPGNRGVLVDMDYFDMVVRNVIPSQSSTNNSLPDSGIMMVNPRDVTVIFSKEMSIQGRPLNAQIVYEKFTHKMTPTRMRVALTMRVVYMGPVRDITTFVREEIAVERRIPFEIQEPQRYDFEYNAIEWESNDEEFSLPNSSDSILNVLDDNDLGGAGSSAVTVAFNRTNGGAGSTGSETKYDDVNPGRKNLWISCDCSSLVWGGFADNRGNDLTSTSRPQSMAEKLGMASWEKGVSGATHIHSTANMYNVFQTSPLVHRLYGFEDGDSHEVADVWKAMCGTGEGDAGFTKDGVRKGDLLIRVNRSGKKNHIAFVLSHEGSGTESVITAFHAMARRDGQDIGTSEYNGSGEITYTHLARVASTTANEEEQSDIDEELTTEDDD